MANRVVVSTKCPTCDAPLDFSEGTNAVTCRFCQSNLLVTGRRQLLSYFIAPKLRLHRAVARTMLAHKKRGQPCRVVTPQLYFIPFYRLTGHDLRWERQITEQQPVRAHGGRTRLLRALGARRTRGIIGGIIDKMHDGTFEIGHVESRPKFRDRYIEKSFSACDVRPLGIYSLGVRPSVMKLELFSQQTVESQGNVVAINMTPEQAVNHGLKIVGERSLLFRRVLHQTLSIIYFPFWIMETVYRGRSSVTVVDAVSCNVTKLNGPMEIYETLDRAPRHAVEAIGFRPLVCPNCGWDLPVRAQDVIFSCSSCGKAWQITGKELHEVSYQVAVVPGHNGKDPNVQYLPFWTMQAQINGDARQFYMPAFRYRRLKYLKDLGKRLSGQPRHYSVLEGKAPELHGCFYDRDDAVRLAQLTYVDMELALHRQIDKKLEQHFTVSGISLVWFPFTHQTTSLIDPFMGWAVPQSGLI